jgi:hypothetical protein
MKLFVTPDKYDGVTQIKEAKADIQSFLFSFSINDVTSKFSFKNVPYKTTAVGGLSGGRLGDVDQVNFNGSKQLIITAPLASVAEGIYLKGYVGSVYTGRSWEEHSDADDEKYKELLAKLPSDKFVPGNQNVEFLNIIAKIKNNPEYKDNHNL